MDNEVIISPLRRAIGCALTRVQRIHYTVNGKPDTDFGPIELTIGERVFLIDNASDGETLRIFTGAWQDPFSEPLSPANREFVARSGKWSAYDVSRDSEFASLIGEILERVDPVSNSAGKITGVVLHMSRAGIIRLEVAGDELYLAEVSAAKARGS